MCVCVSLGERPTRRDVSYSVGSHEEASLALGITRSSPLVWYGVYAAARGAVCKCAADVSVGDTITFGTRMTKASEGSHG